MLLPGVAEQPAAIEAVMTPFVLVRLVIESYAGTVDSRPRASLGTLAREVGFASDTGLSAANSTSTQNQLREFSSACAGAWTTSEDSHAPAAPVSRRT